MPDLPKKKVGIVACSGEELPAGTVTRLAALKVLEELRPGDTVTICLPLFLAGGEGDRAFARFYPTIAVDGCDKRCAARATEMYSSKPAASLVVEELITDQGLKLSGSARRLDESGQKAVEITANRIAEWVDELLHKHWSRRTGTFIESMEVVETPKTAQAGCLCGGTIPSQEVMVNGGRVTLVALPLIFQQCSQTAKPPDDKTADEILEIVKIYNQVPAEEEAAYRAALLHEYELFCNQQEAAR